MTDYCYSFVENHFVALNNDVYGNSLFTCLSVPPPAFFKAINLLQSNVKEVIVPKISHILQRRKSPAEDEGKSRRYQWSLLDAGSYLGMGNEAQPPNPLALALV